MALSVLTYGDAFRLTLITNDPTLAAQGDSASIDRIGVDLEQIGKAERQSGHDTRLSGHSWDDLAAIARTLRRAALFVRINAVHSRTEAEIETALDLGASVLMLPNFRTAAEVDTFVRMVRHRAHAIVLVELAPAVARIREILAVPGIDEVMFGLNDLHLQFGVANPFEILASPVMDMLSAEVRRKGIPFGVGGLGRIDDTGLPIAPDLVYAQYPRLGATGAWISRCFTRDPALDFGQGARELRARLTGWSTAPPDRLEKAQQELARAAALWRPKL
jgi:HpcH/HpaI aldolase/citrate lyase family